MECLSLARSVRRRAVFPNISLVPAEGLIFHPSLTRYGAGSPFSLFKGLEFYEATLEKAVSVLGCGPKWTNQSA